MSYVKPLFPPTVLNAAGRALKDGKTQLPSGESVLTVINNWRASHNYPLNAFHMTLRNRAQRIQPGALTAQRIKRLESILGKLHRQSTMNLSQMQDIGGCRAVMRTMGQLREIVRLYEAKSIVHQRVGIKDYLANPKPDGYRSVHMIYRYAAKESKADYGGMRVEIQLRTQLQHIWATAVEAAGTFTKQALKSNQGRPEWLRFFACMSTYFAFREHTAPVPNTPDDLWELREEVRVLAGKLHVVTILQSYSVTARRVGEQQGMKYFLVHLDPNNQSVQTRGFKSDESEAANLAYTQLETQIREQGDQDAQAVLVSVDSINTLRRAYPNYFLDTSRFVREVELFLSGAGDRFSRPAPPPPPLPRKALRRA